MVFCMVYALLISFLIHLDRPALGAPSSVTLYGVSIPAPTPSILISPESLDISFTENFSAVNPTPGSDVTTYVVQEIESKVVAVDLTASSTTTVLSTPTTLTFTIIEGASGEVGIDTNGGPPVTVSPDFILSPLKTTTNCTSDAIVENGQVVCLAAAEQLLDQITTVTMNGKTVTTATPVRTEAFTDTFTGVWVPIATLTTGSSTMVKTSVGTVFCAVASTMGVLAWGIA